MEAKELVLMTLKESGAPLKGCELTEKSGLDNKEVDKAIKVLVKEG